MSISNNPPPSISQDSYQNPAIKSEKTTREQLKDLASVANKGKWYKVEEGEIREADKVNFIARFFQFIMPETKKNYALLAHQFKNLISKATKDIASEKDETVKKEMNANLDKILEKLKKINAFNKLNKSVKVQTGSRPSSPTATPEPTPPSTPQISSRGSRSDSRMDSISLSPKSKSSLKSEEADTFESPSKLIGDAKILYENHQLNQKSQELDNECKELENTRKKLMDFRIKIENQGNPASDEEKDKQFIQSEKDFTNYLYTHAALSEKLMDAQTEELTFKPQDKFLQNEQKRRLDQYRANSILLIRIAPT
jgi:hypothetical protein